MSSYAIKIDEMYLFERIDLENSNLVLRISQASREEYDRETAEKVPFESKPLFDLSLTNDDLEELIAEVLATQNSLQPVNNFIEKHYPGSLRFRANKRIYKALTPLYMEALGMDESKAEEITEEDIFEIYPTLPSESKRRIDAIEAIIEVLIYNKNKQLKEGKELMEHLLDTENK